MQILLFAGILLKSPEGNAMEFVLNNIENQKESHKIYYYENYDSNLLKNYLELEEQDLFKTTNKICPQLPIEIWGIVGEYLEIFNKGTYWIKRPNALYSRLRLGLISKNFRDHIHEPAYLDRIKERFSALNTDYVNNNYAYSKKLFDTLLCLTQHLDLFSKNAHLLGVKTRAISVFEEHKVFACNFLNISEDFIDYNLNEHELKGDKVYGTFKNNNINHNDFDYLVKIYKYNYDEKDCCTIGCLNFKGYFSRSCTSFKDNYCYCDCRNPMDCCLFCIFILLNCCLR